MSFEFYQEISSKCREVIEKYFFHGNLLTLMTFKKLGNSCCHFPTLVQKTFFFRFRRIFNSSHLQCKSAFHQDSKDDYPIIMSSKKAKAFITTDGLPLITLWIEWRHHPAYFMEHPTILRSKKLFRNFLALIHLLLEKAWIAIIFHYIADNKPSPLKCLLSKNKVFFD